MWCRGLTSLQEESLIYGSSHAAASTNKGAEQHTKVSLWIKALIISLYVHDSRKEIVSKLTPSQNPVTSGAPDLFYMSKRLHCQQYIRQTLLFTQVWMFGRERKTVIEASRWCNRPRCVGAALLIWVKACAKCPYWRVTEARRDLTASIHHCTDRPAGASSMTPGPRYCYCVSWVLKTHQSTEAQRVFGHCGWVGTTDGHKHHVCLFHSIY